MMSRSINLFLTIVVALLTIWWFAIPFRNEVIVPLETELESLQGAKERYSKINLDALKRKVVALDSFQSKILESYIPKSLRSGRLVYTLAQLAQQNRLNIRGIQYSVVDMQNSGGKKLVIEFQLEGFYENFVAWIRGVELSDVLINVEDIKAAKINNISDVIGFTVKMSAYGINID